MSFPRPHTQCGPPVSHLSSLHKRDTIINEIRQCNKREANELYGIESIVRLKRRKSLRWPEEVGRAAYFKGVISYSD